MPTVINKTVKSSGGDYSSITGLITAISGKSFITDDEQWEVEYFAFKDTLVSAAGFSGATTDATRYIRNYSDTNRITRKLDRTGASYYVLASAVANAWLTLNQAYTVWDGIHFLSTGTGTQWIYTNASPQTFRNCVWDANDTARTWYATVISGSGNQTLENCLSYYGAATGTSNGFYTNNASAVFSAFNCTSINNSSAGYCYQRSNASTYTVKNCIGDGGATVFNNAVSMSGDYNAGSDATAPGANSVDNITLTYVDAANNDYGLDSTDTEVIGVGIGPSSDSDIPTTDIDGDARTGTTTDIGWDLFVSSIVATNNYKGFISNVGRLGLR